MAAATGVVAALTQRSIKSFRSSHSQYRLAAQISAVQFVMRYIRSCMRLRISRTARTTVTATKMRRKAVEQKWLASAFQLARIVAAVATRSSASALCVCALLILLGCGSTRVGESQHLTLELSVRPSGAGPVAQLSIRNRNSRTAIGVSPTFAVDKQYLYIDINGPSGRVPYPLSSEFELFKAPPYICLDAGGAVEIVVSLNHWYPIIGGKVRPDHDIPQEGPHTFDLPKGTYKLKAVYQANDSEVRLRCEVFRGRVESEWVELAIE